MENIQDILASKIAELEKAPQSPAAQKKVAPDTGTSVCASLTVSQAVKKARRDFRKLLSKRDAPDGVFLQSLEDLHLKYVKAHHTTLQSLLREKQTATKHFETASDLKTKLEAMCRSLTLANAELKEQMDSQRRSQEKQRKELIEKFQSAFEDAQKKLAEQSTRQTENQTENEKLRTHLEKVLGEFESRLTVFQHTEKEQSLRLQLSEAKLQQQEIVNQQLAQKESVLMQQVDAYKDVNEQLKSQLQSYGSKFATFQGTMEKSQEVFDSMKTEMTTLRKQCAQYLKEKVALEKKTSKMDVALIEMVEERNLMRQAMQKSNQQRETLKNLCRKLQDELKVLRAKPSEAEQAPLAEDGAAEES